MLISNPSQPKKHWIACMGELRRQSALVWKSNDRMACVMGVIW